LRASSWKTGADGLVSLVSMTTSCFSMDEDDEDS
jgi:hypothetical protein